MSNVVFNVSGMSCQHCVNAITSEVGAVDGVAEVEVDLAAGTVRVTGARLDEAALRAAIDEAGYEVAGTS
ncbi:MAG: copper chaperone [Actinobacteria bacterium]|nr:MAG: copper chaperone [Actinomycetota bacterium]